MARPTYATPRTPSRSTRANRVAAISAALGRPLIPWQRHVLDVALEVLPSGEPAYRRVVLTVPRQSGKSTLTDALLLADLTYPDHRTYYTAQTGRAASDRFRLEVAPGFRRSPLRTAPHRVRWQIGSESIEMGSGARLQVFPPKENALHGNQIDRAIVDEAWSFDIAQGRMLEQAIIPAGRTRPQFSLWIQSTAGNSRSAWLAEQVALGRDFARAERTDTVAYFEWSAEDADPDDVEAIIARHPARTLGADQFIRDAYATMDRTEFLRSFGNVWSGADDLAVPPLLWSATTAHVPAPASGAVFGVDAARDGSRASIAAAWRAADGRTATAVVDARPGTLWLATELPRLAAEHRPAEIVFDTVSPAGGALATLRGVSPTPLPLGWPDVVKACALFMERLRAGLLVHAADPDLDAAARNAAQRFAGDGWAWGRRVSSGPIDPLIALTLAAYRVDVPTGRIGRPVVRAV